MSEQSIIPQVVYKSIPGFIGYRVGDDGSERLVRGCMARPRRVWEQKR